MPFRHRKFNGERKTTWRIGNALQPDAAWPDHGKKRASLQGNTNSVCLSVLPGQTIIASVFVYGKLLSFSLSLTNEYLRCVSISVPVVSFFHYPLTLACCLILNAFWRIMTRWVRSLLFIITCTLLLHNLSTNLWLNCHEENENDARREKKRNLMTNESIQVSGQISFSLNSIHRNTLEKKKTQKCQPFLQYPKYLLIKDIRVNVSENISYLEER